MFITTSRNADNDSKKICKFFSAFFSDVLHIPRGKTQLKKIFEKSLYLGYKYFLIVYKKKEEFFLEIYSLKEEGYLLENCFKIKDLKMKLIFPFNKIKKITVKEKPEFFDLFKEVVSDNIVTIKKDNNFSFLLEEKETGFSFVLEKV